MPIEELYDMEHYDSDEGGMEGGICEGGECVRLRGRMCV